MPSVPATHTAAELYHDHHGWLLGFLARRLDCPDSAADLAQDTFLRILARPDAAAEISAIRKPRNYLAAIANRVVIDHLRRLSIEKALLETLAARPEALALSPEAREIMLETLIEIDTLLDNMPERTRQIFLLAQISGLSYTEIGRRLKLSVTTVRKHFARAMTACLRLAGD